MKPFQVIFVIASILILHGINQQNKSTNPGSTSEAKASFNLLEAIANDEAEVVEPIEIFYQPVQQQQVRGDGRCPLAREVLNATIVKPIQEVREIMQEGRSSIPVATYYYQDQNGIVHQQWTYQSSQPRYVAGQPLRNVMRAQPVRSLLRGVVQRFRCR